LTIFGATGQNLVTEIDYVLLCFFELLECLLISLTIFWSVTECPGGTWSITIHHNWSYLL